MAKVNKIYSFKSFSEIKAQDDLARLKEENENKKKETLSKIEEILDEMGLSDLSELDEDSQNGLITRILGKDTNEGNAFIYAAAKAKQDGNNEFEFEGKTYKVTLKKDTGLKESEMIITEGRDPESIQKEYANLKKLSTKDLRAMWSRSYRIGNPKELDKEGLMSDILRSKYGNKYVDAAFESVVNEAQSVDINYALRRIEEFNRGNETFEETIESIVKDLGYKPTKVNLKKAGEHIGLSQEDEDAIPVDRTLVKELYGILESVSLSEATMQEIDKKVQKFVIKNANDYDYSNQDSAFQIYLSLKKLYPNLIKESVVTEGKKVKVTKKDIEDIEDSGNIDIAYKKAMKILTSLVESVVTEGKDDFMARHSGTNITLKKGYKHYTEEELTNIYNKIGELVKDDLKVKDVTIVFESVATEAEIKSDEEFKEYAFTVLKKAFGEDFDEAKAQEVVDGILKKCDGDYGACVGMLTSSLGESVVTEGFDVINAMITQES